MTSSDRAKQVAGNTATAVARASSSGVEFFGLLTILFVALKLRKKKGY